MAWSYVSASQIENYNKCKRSWFFKSILKVQEIQKGHQALGTSFHLVLEKVPKGLPYPTRQDTNASEEEWDKAKQLADITLPLLPPDPKDRIMREHSIRMDTYPSGPTLVGYIDLAIPTGIGWPALLIPQNEAIVGDYKTLSDFRYMKTPEELANSVQMMTYAKWAIGPNGLYTSKEDLSQIFNSEPAGLGRETVRLLHLYARTKAPFSRSSIRHESAIVGIQQIEDFWGKTLDTIREMEQVAKCGSSDDVEAGGALNGHCEAYGGCHYRDKCGISKESSIKSLFQISKKPPTQDTSDMSGSSILAKIQAARAAAQGQTPVTTPVAANSSTTAQESKSTTDVAVSVKAETPTVPDKASVESAQTGTVENSAVDLVNTDNPKGATPTETVNPGNQPSGHVTPNGPISSLMAKIQSTGHGKPGLTGSVAQALNKELGTNLEAHPGEGMRGQKTIANIGDLIKYASGIVPPDAPARTQAVITTPGTPVVDPEAEPVVSETDDEDGETSASPTPNTSNGPASVPVSTQVAAGKRGRPSKAEMEAKAAAEREKFNAAVEAEVAKRLVGSKDSYVAQERDQLWESERVKLQAELDTAHKNYSTMKLANERLSADYAALASNQVVTHQATKPGPTLYIDCYPVKGKHEKLVDFFEWINPIAAAVAESNGVKDYRLIQYNSKGLLATHMRELVKAEGLPEAMMIPSYAAGADVALEVLTPLAKNVIKKL